MSRAGTGRLIPVARKGLSAILDQGFYSAGNFLLNILLARWLSPSEYGAFALCFSALWLVLTIQQSIVSEPLLVFSRGRFGEETRDYLRQVHWLNLAVAALVLTALALVAAGLAASGHEGPAWAFAGLALATPALYGAVLYRRTAFAFERPELAARAGGIYFLVLLTGIVYLYLTHLLSAFSSFVIVAIASFVVIFLIRAAKLGPASVSNAAARGWREYLCAHLGYGKWALPGGLCAWVPVNLVLIYLAGSKGLDAAGGYRALFNLIQPAVQFNAALGLVTIPILVKAISGGRTGKPLLRIAAGPVALSAAYGLVLLFLGRPLMHLLYGGEYRELATYLWLVAIFPVVTAIGSMLGTALRALERPMYIFFARATGAILVAASWPLMPSRGLLFALLLTLSGLTLITICQAVLIFPARVARAAT